MSGIKKTGITARVIRIDPVRPEEDKIREAARVIKEGGLCAFPTETVYGLGVNAYNSNVVDRLYRIKKRPTSDPIIVHISDKTMLEAVVKTIPDIALKLAEKFWPGPLTLIMERSDNVPENVSAGLPTVAVRMPSHKIALALIREAGVPVAAPSANIFSRPSSTQAQHIVHDFSGEVDIVIDGGDSTIGIESTVIDLTVEPAVLLRPGGTPMEPLQKVMPYLKLGPKYIQLNQGASSSPGMLTKHYSPRAELILYQGESEKVREEIREHVNRLQSQGRKVGLLLPTEDMEVLSDFEVEKADLGAEDDLESIGRNLFACMRELDRKDLDVIIGRSFKSEGLGLAIVDRMIRASEGKVIRV